MITIKMTCYPGSKSETKLVITVGTMREVAPNDVNYPPDTTYGYLIDVVSGGGNGIAHYGFEDYFMAQASAMLVAVSYGNGGFPLNNDYLK